MANNSRSGGLLVRVLDADTGVPMWLAHVWTKDAGGAVAVGAVTDDTGHARLSPFDGSRVYVSFVGYRSTSFVVGDDSLPVVSLHRDTVVLPEVVIFPDGRDVIIPPDVLPDNGPSSDAGGGGVSRGVVGGALLLLFLLLSSSSR